jgi:hypothetical protein
MNEPRESSKDNVKVNKPNYSRAGLEDALVGSLSSCNTSYLDEDKNGDHLQHTISIKWSYLEQAEDLLYKINLYDPLPEFVIYIEDIPVAVREEIKHLDEITIKKTFTNAVRRIYESVNADYFHTAGIYGKVKWKLDFRREMN